MVVHVAEDLPQSLADCVHVQRLADTVVEADGRIAAVVVRDTVAVHVEDVAGAAVGVDVPDDLFVQAHLEGRVVGKDVAVHGVERRRVLELTGARKIDDLWLPRGDIARPQVLGIDAREFGRG